MSGLSDVTGAILAGGLGTRLRSVISDRPKVLAPVNERPFITYLLDHLYLAGVEHTVILTGYLGAMVETAIGKRWHEMKISYSDEERPLGTGGAIRLALPLLDTSTVVVLNGDSFCPTDFQHFQSMHTENDATASILLALVDDTSRYGRVRQHVDGSIAEFSEKTADTTSGWINAGVYLLDCATIEQISPNQKISLERDVFPELVGNGLYGYKCASPFIDIGLPETYGRVERFFAVVENNEFGGGVLP